MARLAAAATAVAVAAAYNNGLGTTPPRGWSTWCTDDLCGLLDLCFEQEIHQIADAMNSTGMIPFGYNLILLDDCWAADTRDANGNIQPDPTRFPSGMADLADYVHGKGLKLGLYTCAGEKTCKFNRTGSLYHEAADAATFASWNIDYVKEDNCGHPDAPPQDYYGNMSRALNATGHEMWFALCDWGEGNPWLWASTIAQSYRAGPDHLPLWSLPNPGNQYGGQGVIDIINHFAQVNNYSTTYGWADPDFLMTGLIITDTESETEFAMWAMFGGPMIVSTDIRNMSAWKSNLLLNGDILRVNNDTLNAPGRQVLDDTAQGYQIWQKQLANGDQAVALLNYNDTITQPITVTWQQLGWPATANVSVYDLFAHAAAGNFTDGYTATVVPHGTAMVRLTLLN